jgi:glycosyltransferase involved in cell wall biosynthesis
MSRTLILLTLNEIEGARQVVPKINRQVADEILAIDGGSTDGTAEALAAQGLKVISQKNRGRGEAFRIGVENSHGDHIVFFSPDGNEDTNDISRLFDALDSGAEMVIASRFLPGSRNEEDDSWIPTRKLANRGFTLAANVLWNRKAFVTDTINGFRGLTRETFKKLSPASTGFTIEYELTIRAMKTGVKIVEIPTIESSRVGGETKAPSIRTGLRFVNFLITELFRP